MVFAIVGITGNVGGHTADYLLSEGKKVRAVVRDEKKGEPWKAKGAEIVVADVNDEAALTKAFTGVEAVFLMLPPLIFLPNWRAENLKIVHNYINAIKNAHVKKVVYLSSMGAHLPSGTGAIANSHDFETEIFKLDIPTAGVRGGSFFENSLQHLKAAEQYGQVYSYYLNPDVKLPFVATKDIGRAAANTLAEEWKGHRSIEVHGPKPYSINDVFKIISDILKKEIKIVPVPPENYHATFKAWGLPDEGAAALADMHHAIDSGHLTFEGKGERFNGPTTYEEFFASKK
eukprot:TRINITY_DN3473_c0_g1_i7.p1 TRINITY_DN3473_c0_g1~~TRINITY_DN3473_c0_g1_i7.p1  ORF type:complete len:288 (+),score=47.42 TRINITY_DN3473_c0_g1_i7:185-1048(+)